MAYSYTGKIAGTKIARLFGILARRALPPPRHDRRSESSPTRRVPRHRARLSGLRLSDDQPRVRRRGWTVNMKRVLRIMRPDGLCARRRKMRGLPYCRHGLATYPNLASDFKPRAPNQLWVADFTYVRLFGSFIFVAIILDAFSRRCIGWSVAHHYRTDLTLGALRMALQRRQPPSGLIHHSDRGSQYAADDYVRVLRAYGIEISMSRAGTPSDNAICERFMRTLKEEEVLIRDYLDIADAVRSMRRYLEVTYNQRRSALGARLSTAGRVREPLSRSPMFTYPSLTGCIRNGEHNPFKTRRLYDWSTHRSHHCDGSDSA